MASLLHWIIDNQPVINFGLLVGAVTYTFITGFILRTSAKQVRTAVQPALTLKQGTVVERDTRQPYLHLGGLTFQNNGNGAALNVVTEVAVHNGGAVSRFPEFNVEAIRRPIAVRAGEDFLISSLHTAVEMEDSASGAHIYKQLHEYEVFVSYASIVGAKYLTHISIGLAGSIDSFYVGEQSLSRRVRIWVGIWWRFYRH